MTQLSGDRLRSVEWRDLLPLTRAEVAYETLITAIVGQCQGETPLPVY